MIHTQNFEGFQKINSTHNDRFIDFLKFALYRILETALLYETEAKITKDPTKKLFLYFLAGKKRVQYVILEIIAANNRGKPIQISNYSNFASTQNREKITLADASYTAIINFALSRAEKDCNLYKSLAVLEEDPSTKKLLTTLSNLSRDFTQDVSSGYARFADSSASN